MMRALSIALLIVVVARPTGAQDLVSTSLDPLPARQWDRECAAHLLRRAGFSGPPAEIDRLFAMGLDAAVDHLVDYESIPYQPAPALVDPLARDEPDRALLQAMTQQERAQYMEERRRAERRTFEEVRLWWLERMVQSPRPLEEKMTLFWHGHFTSGMRKVRRAAFMQEQNDFLMILDQPACSRLLARKLLEFFCRPNPDQRLVDKLALVIRRNHYELKPALKALFKSRAFYHADSRGSLIKGPVELVVSTARQLGVPLADLRGAVQALSTMGQELLEPPNVKGWPGEEKWINTATLLTRYNYVGQLVHGVEQSERERRRTARRERRNASNDEAPADEPGAQGMGMKAGRTPPRSRLTDAEQPGYDPLPTMRALELTEAEQIVDHFAANLLAVPLSSAKREQLVHYLRGEHGEPKFDDPQTVQRIRTMIHLLCSTPEFQMF